MRRPGNYPTQSGVPTTAIQGFSVSWMVQIDAARDQLDPIEWKALLELLATRVAIECSNVEPRLRRAT